MLFYLTARKTGELLYADVCGPFQETSYSGYRYFVCFKDDFSKMRFVYFIKEKSEVIEKLKQILTEARVQGHPFKEFLSDNALEFNNQSIRKLLQKYGVRQRLTTPYTSQQNGGAEKENRTLLEVARSFMYSKAKFPQKCWAELINTAAYILNRTGKSSIDEKTPYEIWYDKKPRIKHLRIIGTPCSSWIPDQKRRKLDPKARSGVLIGYESDESYRIFDLKNNSTFRSRDVIFEKEELSPPILSEENTKLENSNYEIRLNPFHTETQSDTEIESDSETESDTEIVSDSETEEIIEQDSTINTRILRNRSTITKPSRFDDYSMYLSEDLKEPENYSEAMESKQKKNWINSRKNELQSLRENQTWELVELPPGRKAIASKWVYKIKENSDGTIDKFKARLFAKGYSQSKSIDYEQTFSPVANKSTVRTLISVAAKENMFLMQFDVSTAFLYGNLLEEIYMKQPEGFEDGTTKVCKLKRSLYGLKQAPRCWNERFGKFLSKLNFVRSTADSCLYIRDQNGHKILLALYDDDGLVASTSHEESQNFLEELKKEFKITYKPATYFLGIEIESRSDGTKKISQSYYTKKIVKEFGMENCNAVSTPIIKDKVTHDIETRESFPYRSAIGALLYLATGTRPDIAFTVSYLARSVDNPSKEDITKVKRVFRYLKGTLEKGIIYRSNSEQNHLEGYSDADHAGDQKTGHSTTGIVCLYAGGAISWTSQKQSSVAISTTEAEIMAASEATKEIIWIHRLLGEITKVYKKPTLWIDNEAAIKLSKNPEFHKRTKHIKVRHFFVREKVQNDEIEVLKVSSENQLADGLTKPLHKPRLMILNEKLGMD
ncbi:UNVERIFIED_CONTAM: hypothetical protein RMT77_012658 [Armadillidium vulgare]